MKGKKTILYLINGFGVASKDSYDLRINDTMPNMSMLMGNYIYSTISNDSYNYSSGYRNFSLGHRLLPTYDVLDNDREMENNKIINSIANDAIYNGSKVHLFCFLDNERVVNDVVKIATVLNNKERFMIYIHIILRQKQLEKYEDISKMTKQLDDKITLLKNVSIGVIVGSKKLSSDVLYKLLTKEIGEKWPDYDRKIDFSNKTGILPCLNEAFFKNGGFKLMSNDIALFMNFEDVDCSEIINRITNVKLYTLFPMKDYSYAINVYEEISPTNYFSKLLEGNDLKCLFITKKDRIPKISYSLCGLSEERSKNIDYIEFSEKSLKDILKSDYQCIVFDYDLTEYEEIRKMKDFLTELDKEIDQIYRECDQYDINFVISSLYGLNKEYSLGASTVKLDFSQELPVLLISNNIVASKYTLRYGDSNALSNTIINMITEREDIETLIRKRGILSMFQ